MKKLSNWTDRLKGSKLKKLGVYTFANFANKGIVFLVVPILTHYLTPSEQGTLAIFMTTLAILTPLVILQTTGAISVEYYKEEFGKSNFARYLSSGLQISLVGSAGLLAILVLFRNFITNATGLSIPLLLVIPFVALTTSWIEMLKVTYIVQGKSVQFGKFLIAFTSFDLLLSLGLVISYMMGFEGRVLGLIAAKLVFGLLALYLLKRQRFLTLTTSKRYQKDIFTFGIFLLPHALGAIIIHSSDQFFIRYFEGAESLGIYSVAYAIGSVIMLIDLSLGQVFTPHLMSQLKGITLDGKKKLVRLSYLYAGTLIICIAGLLLIVPFIFNYLIDDRYQDGIHYVPIIATGYLFLGFYKIVTNYLFYLKKTKLIGTVTLLSAIFNLILNWILIERMGAVGAAWSTLISFFLFFVVMFHFANKYYPMPWLSALKSPEQ